jgi:hypothetical protein
MEVIRNVMEFLNTNREVLIGLVLSVIAVIKLTSWGRAKASALDAVIGVIERLGASNVKQAVAAQEKRLTAGALDALKTSVAKADPKQTVPGPVTRTVREVFRGILPK